MILYSKDTCTRCQVLKTKLQAKNIVYDEITDEAVIAAKGIDFLPMLEVDGELLDFGKANTFINSL